MKNFGYGFLSAVLLVGLMCFYVDHSRPKPISGLNTLTGPTVTETLPVKSYPQANKKLGIPIDTKVLISTKLINQTVTATLDPEGAGHLYIRTDPIPWFGHQKKQTLSVISGPMAGEWVNRLEYRYDLYQVKRLNIGLGAETNLGSSQGHKALIGVSLSYSW